MTRSRQQPNQAAKWLPAVAAAGLLGTVVVAGVALGGGDRSGPTTPADSIVVSADVSNVPAIEPVATAAPISKVPLDRTLGDGVAGDDVRAVQQRLTDLGFWPGPVDGVFGEQTIKAVWAYEKLVLGVPSDDPTGRVTPEMWDAMQDSFVIQPRRPDAGANHTEVYLPEQVLAIFDGDTPVMITHISSGSNEEWCEEVTISPGEEGNRDGIEPLVRGECGKSVTPGGVYDVDRKVDGIRQSALGGMYNPVYFNYGIAIHGALNVPLRPASHGCIRVPLALSEPLQELIAIGGYVYVFDGVHEPEYYGNQPPVFNTIDKDYVTTTTSTTTTTTIPPSTTVAPSTTVPPSTTTAATTPTIPSPAATSPSTTTAPPG